MKSRQLYRVVRDAPVEGIMQWRDTRGTTYEGIGFVSSESQKNVLPWLFDRMSRDEVQEHPGGGMWLTEDEAIEFKLTFSSPAPRGRDPNHIPFDALMIRAQDPDLSFEDRARLQQHLMNFIKV